MGKEKVIMSRVMESKFVLVLYKFMGEPATMYLRVYINKNKLIENNIDDVIYKSNGKLNYFKEINGNNDFLFDNFKKWKCMLEFQYNDIFEDYTNIIKYVKNIILNNIENIKNERINKLENKYVFKF